jgi:hypothetical protein
MEKGFLEFPFPKHLHVTTKQKKYLSIDLGLDNLVSAVSSEGDAFLISGKKLKVSNQWYNKSVSKFRSHCNTEKYLLKKYKLNDKIYNTTQKIKRLVKDYFHRFLFKLYNIVLATKSTIL